jgi:hypothetical protein
MQALARRFEYETIELEDPIGADNAPGQENQITELAKKMFSDSGVSPRLSERINQSHLGSSLDISEEAQIKGSWRYWVVQNSFGLHVTEGMVGSLLAVFVNILLFTGHMRSYIGTPLNVLAGLLAGDGLMRLSSSILGKPIQEKLDSLKERKELASSNKECSEKIIQYANKFVEFLDDWLEFQGKPDNRKFANLFIAIDVLSKEHADLLQFGMQKADKIKDSYKNFIEEFRNFIPFEAVKLFLMEESCCSFLKDDSIVAHWEELKKSPSKNFLWLEEKAEPWQSLKLKNPDSEGYTYFFKYQKEYRGRQIVQKIWATFLDSAKKL